MRKTGRSFGWSLTTRGTRRIRVPRRHLRNLADEELGRIELFETYLHEVHFPKKFPVFEHNPMLNLKGRTLRIDGKRIKVTETKETGKHGSYGSALAVRTELVSIEGTPLMFKFFENGTVEIMIGRRVYPIVRLKTHGDLLVVTAKESSTSSRNIEVPFGHKELKTGIAYDLRDLRLRAKAARHTSMCEDLKRIFGYHNIENLKAAVEKCEVALMIGFDNGHCVHCENPKLVFTVPRDVARVESIAVLLRRPPESPTAAISEALRHKLNQVSRMIERASATSDPQNSGRLKGQLNDLVGDISEELIGQRKKMELLDFVSKTLRVRKENLHIKGPQWPGPDFLVKNRDTNRTVAIVEVKGTLNPRLLGHELAKTWAAVLTDFSKLEYKNVELGLMVAVQFDPKRILQEGKFQYAWTVAANPNIKK